MIGAGGPPPPVGGAAGGALAPIPGILPVGVWTVVAEQKGAGRWVWRDSHGPDDIRKRVADGVVIVMHRRVPGGYEMVARPTCRAWQRVQDRLAKLRWR